MPLLTYFNRSWLALWLAANFVYLMSRIGETSVCEPVKWTLPLVGLGFLGSSALIGWLAAKEHSKAKEN